MCELDIKNLEEFPQYIKEVVSLISTSFNYDDLCDYQNDFFPQFKKSNLKNCFFIEVDNQVIAHIGVLPTEFLLKDNFYTINFFGSIAIKEQFRNKGIFKKFFNSILEKFKNKSVLNILWSEKNKLFNKSNFYQCGEVYQLGLKPIDFKGKSITSLTDTEVKAMLKIYNQFSKKYFCPSRTIKSFQSLLNIKSCQVHFLFNNGSKNIPNKEITGYLLFNKGGDLKDIIHEFVSLNNADFKKYSDYKLWSPLSFGNDQEQLFYCALLQINNRCNFKDLYQQLCDQKITDYKNTDNDQQILINLFGPKSANKNQLSKYSLWIPGLNSI